MDYETKADTLQAVFEPAVTGGVDTAALDALKADVARLSGLVAARPIERPALAGSKAAGSVDWLRKGGEAAAEVKAATISPTAKGGVAVPVEIDAVNARVLAAASPIRSIAQVVDIGSVNYRKLITTTGVVSGWVAETALRPETETPDFAEIAPPMGELYANPAASQAMLDDAMFDVESWLGEEIGREFARAEGVAFVSGDGVSKPRGFLTAPVAVTGDAARAFGTLQYVAAGAAGAFAASNPQDRLIDLVQSLAAPYRQGAAWVMNAATLAQVRKMKDSTGGFIWQPSLAADQPTSLLGYPVVEVDAMPDVAANSLSIAFGNFQAGYLIAQRPETMVLRDPYTRKPFVHFYATRRVGGSVIDSRAIKVLRFSAT